MPTIKQSIEEALQELQYAKHNAKDCPAEHREDFRKLASEFEHTDLHIDSAIEHLKEALKKGGVY